MLVVETKVRHPRLIALLAGACALVAAVALIGPRTGGPVGIGDASATTPDEPEQTVPSDSPSDDGVVFTAPGELVEVFEPPTTSADVEATSAAPVTTTAPSVTSSPEPSVANSSSPTTAAAPSTTDAEGVEATTTTSTDAPAATATDGDAEGLPAENALATSSQVSAGASLLAAPELSGTANGTTIDGPELVGQLGTRDSSSVPWMLLIAANFGVTVSALVFLRLRR